MSDRFHLSPYRITTALGCPLRYYRKYLAEIPEGRGSLPMWAGKRQHEALEAWPAGADLLASHHDAWLEQLPPPGDGLFRDALALSGEVAAFDASLQDVADAIQAARPKIKDPRRTNEFKEAAAKDGGLGERLARILGQLQVWGRSDAAPWDPNSIGPMGQFRNGEAALVQFLVWWDSLSADARPDIVHTEAKASLQLDGGARGFHITGVIDAVYGYADGAFEVVDYKRSGGREDPIDHFVQAAVYALTCELVSGIVPDRVVFHHLQEGERLVYPVQPDWTARLVELCERVERIHATQDFAPSFRTCSWCDYVQLCRDHFSFVPIIEPAKREEAAA